MFASPLALWLPTCLLLSLLLPAPSAGLSFQAYSDGVCTQPISSYGYTSQSNTSAFIGGQCYNSSFTAVPTFPAYPSYFGLCSPSPFNASQVGFNIAPYPQLGCAGNETLVFYFNGYQAAGVCSPLSAVTLASNGSGSIVQQQKLWAVVNCTAVAQNGAEGTNGRVGWALTALLLVSMALTLH